MSTLASLPRKVLDVHRVDLVRVLKAFGVKRAGVFGSTARGTDGAGSDLDLIVEFSEGMNPDLIRLATELSEVAGISVDVVDVESVIDRAQATGIGTSILRDTVPL